MADFMTLGSSTRVSQDCWIVYCTARVDTNINSSAHADQDVYLQALRKSHSVDRIEFGNYVARTKKALLARDDPATRKPLLIPVRVSRLAHRKTTRPTALGTTGGGKPTKEPTGAANYPYPLAVRRNQPASSATLRRRSPGGWDGAKLSHEGHDRAWANSSLMTAMPGMVARSRIEPDRRSRT